MDKIRIFISSPGDVSEERLLTQRVLHRMGAELADRVRLEPIFWEHEPLLASDSFQQQIVRPSTTDIMICILWSRLGTRLPDHFRRSDGSTYASGTEFELEDAISSFREVGKPSIVVYRKTTEPLFRLQDKPALLEKLHQREALDQFIRKWFFDKSGETLTGAFHKFETSDQFEELLEKHVRKLLQKRIREGDGQVERTWHRGSPYLGLSAFEEEHAPVFHGRTKAVSEILSAFRSQAADGRAFVLILGLSGSGKSSLARAGVLPMLSEPGVIEGVGAWRRAVIRPSEGGENPFRAIAKALLSAEMLPTLTVEPTGSSPLDSLTNLLLTAPQRSVVLIRKAITGEIERLAIHGSLKLMLVIDQLEEVFTSERLNKEDQQTFFELLEALATSGNVWILSTLRNDFYPLCVAFEPLARLKEGTGQYDLAPPSPAEIRQMIRRPARAAGLLFERDPSTGEALDEILLESAQKNPESLPLLEFTLEQLYEKRSEDGILALAAYSELGGLEGSIGAYADAVIESLPEASRAQLPQLFQALVKVELRGTATLARRYATLESFQKDPEIESLISVLVRCRLLVSDRRDGGGSRISLIHEALLTRWPSLASWVELHRDILRSRARISAAARAWLDQGKNDDLLLGTGQPIADARRLLEEKITLEPATEELIEASLAKDRNARRQRTALIGGGLLIALANVIGAWLYLQRIVPVMAELYASQGEDLSLATRYFVYLSQWFNHYAWLIGPIGAATWMFRKRISPRFLRAIVWVSGLLLVLLSTLVITGILNGYLDLFSGRIAYSGNPSVVAQQTSTLYMRLAWASHRGDASEVVDTLASLRDLHGIDVSNSDCSERGIQALWSFLQADTKARRGDYDAALCVYDQLLREAEQDNYCWSEHPEAVPPEAWHQLIDDKRREILELRHAGQAGSAGSSTTNRLPEPTPFDSTQTRPP